MSEEKNIRLSKIARELNIGIHTITDFLASKGNKIDHNPNTKIGDDLYRLLLKEFQPDKFAKEESQMVAKSAAVKKDSIVLEAQPDLNKVPGRKDSEQDEILIKNIGAHPFSGTPEDGPREEVIKAKADKLEGLKVVGSINVEPPVTKGKKGASKKTAPPVPEETPPASPAPPSENLPPQEEEPFRLEREKLQGPVIVGKMDLPSEPPKRKPVASSSGVDRDQSGRKKKRKRKERPVNSGYSQGERGLREKGHEKNPAREEVSDKEIQDQIKATLAKLSGPGKSRSAKYRRQKRDEASQVAQEAVAEQEAQKNILKVTEFVSASELAKMMNLPVNDIISSCLSLGLFVSINQRLDAETISVVAEEFGHKVEFVTADIQEDTAEEDEDNGNPEDMVPRPPIVTVMGHVDHGKTSLLDYIRKANVIAGEAGGITQHIGAYEVTLENNKQITFLDTPGHEAFTAMRARGAKITDVAIIVVAADDSVMPQTVEAINHAQAAGVPLIFAINKIDKPGANAEKIREQLSKMNILVEEWGGKYQCQEISAKKGEKIDLLLEKVLLESDLLELKANPKGPAKGTVIESSLDKGRGYIMTVLVQSGTLRLGDIVLAGSYSGRVKALFNERGNKAEEAGPATPVLVLGMDGAPQAGDTFKVMYDERKARDIANRRMQLIREQGIRTHKHITLEEVGRRLAIGNFKELNIIVKGDVDGSVEALSDALLKLSTSEIQVNVIHKSVGQISESDVLLASASNAVIVGFQVRPSLNARKIAEQEQIDIRLYSIIYDAINEVKMAMEGMLTPEFQEKIVCNIEVREVFKITKVGTIAGCMVKDGKITRQTKVRVIRDGIVVYTGELSSLKRFKDDVKEVASGYECGLGINNFNDMKVGDIVEGYEQVAVKRTI